jgi:hypothetical protein
VAGIKVYLMLLMLLLAMMPRALRIPQHCIRTRASCLDCLAPLQVSLITSRECSSSGHDHSLPRTCDFVLKVIIKFDLSTWLDSDLSSFSFLLQIFLSGCFVLDLTWFYFESRFFSSHLINF